MMRPGAGQNYPRSGFPLEGKAAPVLLPVGKGIIVPGRAAGTKRTTPHPGPPELAHGGLQDSLPPSPWAVTAAAAGSGLAPCEEPVPGAGETDREVGGAAGPGSLSGAKGGDLGSPKFGKKLGKKLKLEKKHCESKESL